MRFLVTGAAGFIGSNYVRQRLAKGRDEIVILDALTYAGHRSTLADLLTNDRIRFVHGDITDRAVVGDALRGCQAVLHFAAETHVDRSLVGPDAFIATNCGGTNVLCDEARHHDIERFVHVSTDEVYGSVEQGSSHEDDGLDPRSPYSASKAASDLIARSYASSFGLPVLITRSSNNFGPFQHPEKLVPRFITNLIDGASVPLYGTGGNQRDWCPVADNCTAIDLVLDRGVIGETYNIGAGYELTNLELTHRLLALCGRDERAIEFVADRPGHDRRYSLDCTKIRALGWTGPGDLDTALEATVAWYYDRRDWWEPIRSAS